MKQWHSVCLQFSADVQLHNDSTDKDLQPETRVAIQKWNQISTSILCKLFLSATLFWEAESTRCGLAFCHAFCQLGDAASEQKSLQHWGRTKSANCRAGQSTAREASQQIPIDLQSTPQHCTQKESRVVCLATEPAKEKSSPRNSEAFHTQ